MQTDSNASPGHYPGTFHGWKRDSVFFTVLGIHQVDL